MQLHRAHYPSCVQGTVTVNKQPAGAPTPGNIRSLFCCALKNSFYLFRLVSILLLRPHLVVGIHPTPKPQDTVGAGIENSSPLMTSCRPNLIFITFLTDRHRCLVVAKETCNSVFNCFYLQDFSLTYLFNVRFWGLGNGLCLRLLIIKSAFKIEGSSNDQKPPLMESTSPSVPASNWRLCPAVSTH